jgi:activating signal cointegrator complex subunit 3
MSSLFQFIFSVQKFLYTPFPVESCLSERLCENLNAEITIGTVNSVIDAVGYLTWTFFARRIKANPSYYGAESSSDEHVEDFLLSVAKDTLEKLHEDGCVEIDKGDGVDADVKTTTLGIACTNYYLKYRTPKQMQFGIREARKIITREIESEEGSFSKSDIKTRGNAKLLPFSRSTRVDDVSAAWLLYSVSCTHEFDEVPVRHSEDQTNEELSDDLMWGPDAAGVLAVNGNRPYTNPEVFADPHTKCFLLLQAHLERARLPVSDYVNDTKSVIENVPRLLAAMHYIALQDATTSGSFELITQFSRTRQLLETRSTVSKSRDVSSGC